MKAIVATDRNWAIGKDGDLLCHIKGDMKFFREHTTGNICIMGRKTLDSMPGGKPLPKRTTWVLTRNLSVTPESILGEELSPEQQDTLKVFYSEEELLDAVREAEWQNKDREDGQIIYVCGGEQIYRQLLPYCEEALVTRIDRAFPADKHFPVLEEDPDWEMTFQSEDVAEGEGDEQISYRFCTYSRK